MDNTIIQQGTFRSPGAGVFILLRSDVDWMEVRNYSATQRGDDGEGVRWYWQRGLPNNDGFIEAFGAGDTILLSLASEAGVPGFELFNSSVPLVGDKLLVNDVTGGPPPLVSVNSTGSQIKGKLVNGDVVRLYAIAGGLQLSSIDFEINNVVADTSFDLAYMRAIVPAAGPGFYARVAFGTHFLPTFRYITRISNEVQALVTLTVRHGYEVGQVVRFTIPKVRNSTAYGMNEIDQLQGTIVDTGEADVDGVTNTIRVDIDTTAFNPFLFPGNGAGTHSPAIVTPVGENTGVAIATGLPPDGDFVSDDSTIGMFLGYDPTGAGRSPAGIDGDTMYWRAGKSFAVDNKAF